MLRVITIISLIFLAGCGPSKTDQATSQVRRLAAEWSPDEPFPAETDPWNHLVTGSVQEGAVYRTITTRSNGPDGLPYTGDDIVASSRTKHTSVSEAGGKALENLGEGAARGSARGLVRGLKEGLKPNGK